MVKLRILFLTILMMSAHIPSAWAAIHSAPVVISGFKIRRAAGSPLSNYKLFATNIAGEVHSIPFQIDEVNRLGDYVLEQGAGTNKATGNGIFDLNDELTFMGDDVGSITPPRKWGVSKPDHLYEIRFIAPSGGHVGSVFLGIYTKTPVPTETFQNYVVYNVQTATVITSRYYYRFDEQNYLVSKNVHLYKPGDMPGLPPKDPPLLHSSTFFLKADFKYFLTFLANHRSINSKLEAYKSGPVRTILRVSFVYSILKLNFQLGMYTEISFFSNSLLLPTVMYNPIEGKDALNSDSGFYYGFAFDNAPSDFKLDTNMESYPPKSSLINYFRSGSKSVNDKYWLSMTGADRSIYVEFTPSVDMLKHNNIPFLYSRNAAYKDIASVSNITPSDLSNPPVNIAVFFDLSRFVKGEHVMQFQIFVENKNAPGQLEMLKNLPRWHYYLQNINSY